MVNKVMLHNEIMMNLYCSEFSTIALILFILKKSESDKSQSDASEVISYDLTQSIKIIFLNKFHLKTFLKLIFYLN